MEGAERGRGRGRGRGVGGGTARESSRLLDSHWGCPDDIWGMGYWWRSGTSMLCGGTDRRSRMDMNL